MTHGSLFSGIGGFDLAAQWMGWDNTFHVECDPFCRQVLQHHFPKSQSFSDVKTFDATQFRGRVRVISGGFPCQPFSAAGKRAGTSDDRYLWPDMFRIIREVRPTYVVAENVRGLLSWNDGLVLDTVCSDLESEGYEVFPTVLGACTVNAPHKRDRIWIVANANDTRGCGQFADLSKENGEVPEWYYDAESCHAGTADAANAISTGLQGGSEVRNQARDAGEQHARSVSERLPCNTFEDFPTVAPVCGGDDGLPKRLDGISIPKWRRESIKAYGNAIVPQVAHQIFKAIQDAESCKH